MIDLSEWRQSGSLWRICRFLVAGGFAALVNIIVLYILTEYGRIWYVYSSVFAFLVAFAANFVLQKYWVFESAEHSKISRQLPMHLGAALFNNLFLNTLLLYSLVEYGHLWYIAAQLIASAFIAIESFLIFRWIFR